MSEKKYPERGCERYYLVASGGDYDRDIDVFESYINIEKLRKKIKELLSLESYYFKGGMVKENNIHVVYGREIPWSAEKELVKEIKIDIKS